MFQGKPSSSQPVSITNGWPFPVFPNSPSQSFSDHSQSQQGQSFNSLSPNSLVQLPNNTMHDSATLPDSPSHS